MLWVDMVGLIRARGALTFLRLSSPLPPLSPPLVFYSSAVRFCGLVGPKVWRPDRGRAGGVQATGFRLHSSARGAEGRSLGGGG